MFLYRVGRFGDQPDPAWHIAVKAHFACQARKTPSRDFEQGTALFFQDDQTGVALDNFGLNIESGRLFGFRLPAGSKIAPPGLSGRGFLRPTAFDGRNGGETYGPGGMSLR